MHEGLSRSFILKVNRKSWQSLGKDDAPREWKLLYYKASKPLKKVRMIPSPNLLSMITVFFGILFFLILTFLPSIVELKKPKDPGPRIIVEYNHIYLSDLENRKSEDGELKANVSILGEIMAILTFLPDLES
jgi:hypothetical protein